MISKGSTDDYKYWLNMKRERVEQGNGKHTSGFLVELAEVANVRYFLSSLFLGMSSSLIPWFTNCWILLHKHYTQVIQMKHNQVFVGGGKVGIGGKRIGVGMWGSRIHTKRKIHSDFQSSESSNCLLSLFHDYKSLIIYDSWKPMWFMGLSHTEDKPIMCRQTFFEKRMS